MVPLAGREDEVIGLDMDSVGAQLDLTGKIEVTLPSGELVRVEDAERYVRALRPLGTNAILALKDGREVRGPFQYWNHVFWAVESFEAIIEYGVATVRFD